MVRNQIIIWKFVNQNLLVSLTVLLQNGFQLEILVLERPFSLYVYRLFLLYRLSELTSLKSQERFLFRNQIICDQMICNIFLSLSVFSQNRCQFEIDFYVRIWSLQTLI